VDAAEEARAEDGEEERHRMSSRAERRRRGVEESLVSR